MITALFARGSFIQFQSLFKFCLSLLRFFCSLKGGHRRRYAPGLLRTHQQLFFTHEKTNFSVKSSLQSRHQFFFCFFLFWLVHIEHARGTPRARARPRKFLPSTALPCEVPKKSVFNSRGMKKTQAISPHPMVKGNAASGNDNGAQAFRNAP